MILIVYKYYVLIVQKYIFKQIIKIKNIQTNIVNYYTNTN